MEIKELKLPPQVKKIVYEISPQGKIIVIKTVVNSGKKLCEQVKIEEGCKIQLGQLNSIQITKNIKFKDIIKDNPFVSIHTPKNYQNDTKRKLKCNCKKSKCMKLYCECFSNQLACGSQCECLNCSNLELNTKRLELLEEMNLKPAEGKGCKCTKSNCQKKYCECFNRGVPCGSSCGCENCLNSYIKQQIISP